MIKAIDPPNGGKPKHFEFSEIRNGLWGGCTQLFTRRLAQWCGVYTLAVMLKAAGDRLDAGSGRRWEGAGGRLPCVLRIALPKY